MDAKNLSVYIFKTNSENQYIYDNVTGLCLPCPDSKYYIISNFFNNTQEQLQNELLINFNIDINEASTIYNEIKLLINSGMFYMKSSLDTKINIDEEDLLKIPNAQLILVLTENCNLRCKYCVYSDMYPEQVNYSQQKMTFDVAKKAIDHFKDLYEARKDHGLKKKPIISFYGGEPFLEFQLIKQIVKYCKEIHFDVSYGSTTNATIMTDEIINFIIENNVFLAISLDGDKASQNRNRVFMNGDGSFDTVYKNICLLQSEKKKRKKEIPIVINCVFDHYSNLVQVSDFFEENAKILKPYVMNYLPVSNFETKYYDYCDKNLPTKDKNLASKSLEELKLEVTNKLMKNEKIPPSISRIFLQQLITCFRKDKGLKKEFITNCIPTNKIAVSPLGEFYPCERCSQKIIIGNIENGINLAAINDINNQIVSLRKEHCNDCNFSRLCDLCYAQLSVKDTNISFNYSHCETVKSSYSEIFKEVFSILEENDKAFTNLL